MEQICRTIELS